MQLDQGVVWCRVLQAPIEEERWLDAVLTYEDPRAHYVRHLHGRNLQLKLYDRRKRRFPAGFVPLVRKLGKQAGHPVRVIAKPVVEAPDPDADLEWLRDYQTEAADAVINRHRGILSLPTGAGKCLGLGTPVLTHSGGVLVVEDVRVGDRLMGPDGQPRTVLSTTQGSGLLYRVIPKKGASWVCNRAHVLTLAHTVTGEVVDIPLAEYLAKSAYWKHCHKLFQPGPVEFSACAGDLPIDPYFVGVWYGDGRRDLSQGISITKPDHAIQRACARVARQWDAELRVDRYPGRESCPTYRIVTRPGRPNKLLSTMRTHLRPDRLPDAYRTASVEDRRLLLAGLLDTDGHLTKGYYEIVQDRAELAEDIVFVARSLGFRVAEGTKWVGGKSYARLSILGDATDLPLRIPRKKPQPRRQKKNPRRTGFTVEYEGRGPFAGFTLGGPDGRFLLGDFTVTHNTEVAVALTRLWPDRHWLFVVHRSGLAHQAAHRYVLRNEQHGIWRPQPGMVGDGQWRPGEHLTVATFQTLAKHRRTKKFKALAAQITGLICDEVHTLPATTFLRVAMALDQAPIRIGLSGTPLARGDKRSLLAIGATGPIIYKLPAARLIAAGVLSQPQITMVPVTQDRLTYPTWQGLYGAGVVRSSVRNRAITQIVQHAAKPALVFVKQMNHGRALLTRMQAAGVACEFVWGKASQKQREAAIERLVRGEIDALICSVIFQEGVDIPELRSVVVGCGGRSVIGALQRIGRGMRRTEDKREFEVWDIQDNDSGGTLERHAKARVRAYKKQGYSVRVCTLAQLAQEVMRYGAPGRQGEQ